jgi:hypothetical protein
MTLSPESSLILKPGAAPSLSSKPVTPKHSNNLIMCQLELVSWMVKSIFHAVLPATIGPVIATDKPDPTRSSRTSSRSTTDLSKTSSLASKSGLLTRCSHVASRGTRDAEAAAQTRCSLHVLRRPEEDRRPVNAHVVHVALPIPG